MRHVDNIVPCLCGASCHLEWPRLQLASKMKLFLVTLALLPPLTAMADSNTGNSHDDAVRICTNLIPDVKHSSNLPSLTLTNNGNDSHFVDSELLICSYWAPIKNEFGDVVTYIASVEFNTTSKRFSVQVN